MKNEIGKNYDPNLIEDMIYSWWEENQYFKPEIMENIGIIDGNSKPFVNTLPPPNVTGVLHLGHAMTIAIQDLFIRYARMNGRKALFVPGTDHAGIATQNVVERELNKDGVDRKILGREKFIDEVWKWKEKSHTIITEQSKKLGLSSDWEREAFTMDENLSKAVRTAFVRLYNKGLIYKGNYLVNWCPGRCESAISDLEAEPNEIEGKLWFIRYPLIDDEWSGPKFEWGSGNWLDGAINFIEIATTRPETMLGDTAVAISNEKNKYSMYKGKKLILPITNREIEIVEDEYVDQNFGTGAVKITPAHDFNDYEIGKRHDLDFITIMNEKGYIENGYGKYSNLERFEARKQIVEDLEKENLIVKIEDYTHSIPKCQRCDTIIEPRDSLQWWVKASILTKQVQDKIEEEGLTIVPENQMQRLQKWLDPEFIKDWCISRQLWWGHRIPVWYCKKEHVTVSENIPIKCAICGDTELIQDEDVLDTWFSSALWPFSTLGWPETTEDFLEFYPNTLRETGYDILFFWVARELMMAVELTGKLPYEIIYLHGLIRNEKGKKISKSMENIEDYDPLRVIAKNGADALRYTLIAYSTPGLDMNLDLKNIDAAQKFCNKLWNVFKYILSNIPENFQLKNYDEIKNANLELSDKWILSKLNELILMVRDAYENYKFLEVAREIKRFTWNLLADWYIEISKIRIYDESNDKFDPRHILLVCIDSVLRMLHPIMPYVTEHLWQNLPEKLKDQDGLIIAKFPIGDEEYINLEVMSSFDKLIDLISKIRTIRGEYKVPHTKKISLLVSAGESTDILNQGSKIICDLGKVDDTKLQIMENIMPSEKMISSVIGEISIFIPMEDMINLEDEMIRLEKEIESKTKLANKSKAKLSSDFSIRAPKNIVEEERIKLQKLEGEIEKLEERKKLL